MLIQSLISDIALCPGCVVEHPVEFPLMTPYHPSEGQTMLFLQSPCTTGVPQAPFVLRNHPKTLTPNPKLQTLKPVEKQVWGRGLDHRTWCRIPTAGLQLCRDGFNQCS